VRFFCRCPACY